MPWSVRGYIYIYVISTIVSIYRQLYIDWDIREGQRMYVYTTYSVRETTSR